MTDESIPILRVDDAARAVSWYERLGFVKEWEHRFDPSFPAFVSIARDGTARLFLSEHRGDAQPDTLVYLRVADVDAIAREFDSEIIDQPWGRELHLTDPDGNRLRVGTTPA
jgi:catechol 2,3-dioxygenase-like lactoylglutathione lyase family enzyme